MLHYLMEQKYSTFLTYTFTAMDFMKFWEMAEGNSSATWIFPPKSLFIFHSCKKNPINYQNCIFLSWTVVLHNSNNTLEAKSPNTKYAAVWYSLRALEAVWHLKLLIKLWRWYLQYEIPVGNVNRYVFKKIIR